MISQEYEKVVFPPNLYTHMLIHDFICTLVLHMLLPYIFSTFFVLMSFAGDATFHAAGTGTTASRPPK